MRPNRQIADLDRYRVTVDVPDSITISNAFEILTACESHRSNNDSGGTGSFLMILKKSGMHRVVKVSYRYGIINSGLTIYYSDYFPEDHYSANGSKVYAPKSGTIMRGGRK